MKDPPAIRRAVSAELSSITFNRPTLQGAELSYLAEAISNGQLSGNGPFTKRCQKLLSEELGAPSVLLTHSGTAALEMAALLIDVRPGDEIILPSFTFVSTANAFVLRGATPVFADIRPDTLNLDETLIANLVTEKTKAIVPVHYAGIACDMEALCALAASSGLLVIEDAAQALGASYRGRPLGSFGALGCFSFHETKNVLSGEGGALSVNDPRLAERAEIIWEKGTDRAKFYRGEVDTYMWRDLGSSFLPGELVAAFLFGQLEQLSSVTAQRRALWRRYHDLLEPLAQEGLLQQPSLPADCRHNGHLYWVVLPNAANRTELLKSLAHDGVHAVSHYVPLHSSPAGRHFGRAPLPLPVTETIAERLIRLPLHAELTEVDQVRVADALRRHLPAALRP